MGETHREIRWNDVALDRHCHVCVFYHGHDEEYRLLRLRSHPVAVIGGIVQENPYFVPPDELLRELRQYPRERAGTA